MKILVCGDRDYGDYTSIKRQGRKGEDVKKEYEHILRTLDKLCLNWPKKPKDKYDNCLPAVTIISGKARGVDTVAIDWAVVNWCTFEEYPAEWAKHGKAAGPIRNQQMLDEGKPDLVVAFLKETSKGTKDMVNRALKAGVPVEVVRI